MSKKGERDVRILGETSGAKKRQMCKRTNQDRKSVV